MRYLPLLLLLITACAQIGGPRPLALPTLADDTCGANQYARLLEQPATALETQLILAPVRMRKPDQAVTMDHLPNRLNFHLNPDNRITAISCG